MATSFEIQDVRNFLQQRFITTSSEWVEACIAFVKEEHVGQNLPINVLKDSVYQQWLSADLEEIGVSALPNDLATTQKVTLNGCFSLQVNCIRDVGKPAYTQLKDLEKNSNSNDEFSAAPQDPVPSWESKPTRMLMLNMTDGCTIVQGMEYKSINFLSIALPPGVKVLIQGPVDCRFGVFMLTPEKIRVLGGEVESKLEQFSQKTILKEILHIPLGEEAVENVHNLNVNGAEQLTSDDTENADSVSIIAEGQYSIFQNANTSTADGLQTVNSRNVPSARAGQNTRQSNFSSRDTSEMRSNDMSSRQRSDSHPLNQMGRQSREINDNLDDFEEDDDFVNSLDYGVIDELEKESNGAQVESVEEPPDIDIWQEDEDVLQDLMAFQDENPVFEIPVEVSDRDRNGRERLSGVKRNLPFTYLSSVLENPFSESIVTIKGFIIKVLSKLECTGEKGWSLSVKINDGTATLDANVHDKVLEGIIGISAAEMVKMQKQATRDPEKRKEVMEAISKCKVTLQDFNCLMDVKLPPGLKPCIMKCQPITQLHIQQLLERTRSHF